MRLSLTATALVLAVMLSACGQKGDLYIPDTLAKQEGVAEKSARMPTIHGRPPSGGLAPASRSPAVTSDSLPDKLESSAVP